VLVTRHTPLKDVPGKISARRVEGVIRLDRPGIAALFGIRRPRIVVCGLNPHAGEKEDRRGGAPAYEPGVRAARKGTDAASRARFTGRAFLRCYEGRYDAEVCMYMTRASSRSNDLPRARRERHAGLPFVRPPPTTAPPTISRRALSRTRAP